MIDFNAPIMEPDDDTANSLQSQSAPSAGIIDLNDPRLSSESLEGRFDEQKDAYELPPPVPDATYLARLRHKQVKKTKTDDTLVDYKPGGTKDGSQVYLQTAIEAEIIDPSGRHDGKRITDYFVSTMIKGKGKDASQAVTTILNAGKVPLPTVKTHKTYMDTLIKWLQSEPTIKIVTAWEASWENERDRCKKTGEKEPYPVTGMHKFPLVKGVPSPEMQWPDKSFTRAQPRIQRYLPL